MKEQISALITKAKKYIRSAERLRSDSDYDSAISRLYYSMFYCARALLVIKGFSLSNYAGVIAGFGQHLVKSKELPPEMHEWLREAFDKRQISEYTASSQLDDNDARDLQQKADKFIVKSEEYLKSKGFL